LIAALEAVHALQFIMPIALVIRAAGTNCDAEMARGFEMAGARATLAHVDALIADPSIIDGFDLIGFPGGFSYGDDIASGRIMAVKVREKLWPALRDAARRGCAMIGICNGFQTMVQIGLLPGPGAGEGWPEGAPPPQRVALRDNIGARYMDRWVPIEPDAKSVCVWTKGLSELYAANPSARRDVLQLPVGHGEGRFLADSESTLVELRRNGQVALRYGDNFNGSQDSIAGICDSTGRIFGLMPHPDRFLDWTRHQHWTRLAASVRTGDTPGLMMFKNAVAAVARVGSR